MDKPKQQQSNNPKSRSILPRATNVGTSLGLGRFSSSAQVPPVPVAGFNGEAGMSAQIMGQLMTNPALAVAAAASPLFPPAAMLTNPSAFYTMPEYYQSAEAMQNEQDARESAAAINEAVAVKPQLVTAGQGGQQQSGFSAGSFQQQQQQGGVYMCPMGNAPLNIIPYGAALPPPGLAPNQLASSTLQVHIAASTAATQALSGTFGEMNDPGSDEKRKRKEMTPAERAKQNRERNREHAKTTRMRKKAYIQKLKELVDGLHAERTEEVRQRRVAIQHLAETQSVRRSVIRSFLQFHANYERDRRKWETILDDSFWLKQPVTPYRCFRRSQIEQECRISRGVDAAIADAASVAAMIEGVGSRSTRWIQIKREEFLAREEERTGRKRMPKSIMRQNSRFHHALSSLSSSSGSSNNSSGEETQNKKRPHSRSNEQGISRDHPNDSGEFHDYHAKPLPDPKLIDQEGSPSSPSGEEDSPEDLNCGDDSKQISTDTSSGDDSAAAIKENRAIKRCKIETMKVTSVGVAAAEARIDPLPSNIAKNGGISHNVLPVANPALPKNVNARLAFAPAVPLPPFAGIGKRPNLAAPGTISVADPTLPIGTSGVKNLKASSRRSDLPKGNSNPLVAAIGLATGLAIISGDVETSSSNSSRSKPQIRAYYHVNEDDMILMDDVIMCPFVFRTQDAIMCGAHAECLQQGMIRAHFSSTNKLLSMEMIYDAMGFMQQLERASGSALMAQIVPGSLEMALSLGSTECRAITLAEKPFRIVNVNEPWTKLTKYTQMEAEGLELFGLLNPPSTDDESSSGIIPIDLDDVLEGCCKCTTRYHRDKDGREFVDFVSSYPLTNANDEITHILHVSKDLNPIDGNISEENPDSCGTLEENS